MSLFRRTKNNNKPIIRQILDLIPNHLLTQSIKKHQRDKYCHKYKTRDQLTALLFGQLSKCTTLTDISVGLEVSETFIQGPWIATKSSQKRDWRVFEHLYTSLLSYYSSSLRKYANQQVVEEVKDKTILIRDSSTISLCLSF